MFAEVLDNADTELINSTPYKPSTNGAIEKFNQTLKQAIYHHFAKNNNKIWYPLIFDIVKGYNNTYHTVIKTTPYKAYHNKRLRTQVKKNINKQARQMVYNTRKQIKKIQEGDLVRIIKNGFSQNRDLKPGFKKSGFKKSGFKNPSLKKNIENTYDYDVYKVIKI